MAILPWGRSACPNCCALTRWPPISRPGLRAEGPATVTLRAEGGLDDLALTATVEATDSALEFGDQFRKPQATPLVVTTEARLTPERVAISRRQKSSCTPWP